MHKRAWLLLALWPFAASAALDVETLSATHPRDDTEYRFPLVKGAEPAASAINTWLQGRLLNKLPGRYRKTAFEDVWPQGDSYTGYTEFNYQVLRNDARLLGIEISGEYSAAYPSSFDLTGNFDAATGTPIGLHDLFTQAGLKDLRTQVIAARVKAVKAFIKRIDPKGEDAKDQQALYENCLLEIADESLDYNDLYIDNDGIALQRGDCAPHAQLALDELGPLKTPIATRQIADGLSDYGRCLLAPSAPTSACTLPASKGARIGAYRGTLGGKTPITLVIERIDDDGTLGGGYFYDKYARYIELGGKAAADGTYALHENSHDDKAVPAELLLKATADGALGGEWRGGGKALPVSLQLLR